jgi:probable F420-dependent oxidoreductase
MAAADATTTLRVGVLVLANDYRHPAVLAKEAATLDILSEGRFELGLGAGWMTTDYERAGIPMDRPGVRVSRMVEHLAVLKGLFSPGPFSFQGDHYTVTELDGTPAPHRPGGPPILVGGGAPRVLRFAGAEADIVGVNASIHSGAVDADAALDGMAERIDQKVEWVREGAGDRFADLELNAWLAFADVTDDYDGTAALLGELFGVDPSRAGDSPLVLFGTQTQIAERLEERRDRWGYSYHVVPGDQAHAFAPLVADLTGR